MQSNNWYNIDNIEAIDSPALVVYLDRVKKNIETVIGMVDDVSRLRPHVKTHKTKEASLLMMEAGIQKFKCATIAEAEMLAEVGAKDVLLAYQLTVPKVRRFISLIQIFPQTQFSCLVDNYDSAQYLASEAAKEDLQIPVFIDLNVGMDRTGISIERALKLVLEISNLQGISLKGIHAYDGHIRDKDFEERTKKCDKAFEPVLQLKERMQQIGIKKPIIIAGGTPTFPIHAKREKVECGPGTFVYWDKGYELTLEEQKFLPAALVVSRITSIPSENHICLDLGHKSIASENTLDKRVSFLNAAELKLIGHSEEHLVAETKGGKYKVGDVFYGVPFHVCPTSALYERAIVVEKGKIVGEWRVVARDRKIVV